MSWTYWLDGRDKIAQTVLRGYRIAYTFESFTGADMVVTPIKDQLSQQTIQGHLDVGAILIQNKVGLDMVSSILDGRLFESLARMNTWNAQAYQCGLLPIGVFEKVGDMLHVNGRRSRITWKSYRGAWNAWVRRGGVVYSPVPKDDLQSFVDDLGAKNFVRDPFVQSQTAKPRKKFKMEKQFRKGMTMRQKARLANQTMDPNDIRHLLVNIDGLSVKTVQAIYLHMQNQKVLPNMSSFINLLLADSFLEVKGVGPKINERIKAQLGHATKKNS